MNRYVSKLDAVLGRYLDGLYLGNVVALLRNGHLKQRAHVVQALANAPAALRMIFTRENQGKLVVEVYKKKERFTA